MFSLSAPQVLKGSPEKLLLGTRGGPTCVLIFPGPISTMAGWISAFPYPAVEGWSHLGYVSGGSQTWSRDREWSIRSSWARWEGQSCPAACTVLWGVQRPRQARFRQFFQSASQQRSPTPAPWEWEGKGQPVSSRANGSCLHQHPRPTPLDVSAPPQVVLFPSHSSWFNIRCSKWST